MVRRKMSCGSLLRRGFRPPGREAGQFCVTAERMTGKRPQADRILAAQLTGTAQHHAMWRELTGAGHEVAVAGLRELAAGRADLLAGVAGTLEASPRGSCTNRMRGKPRSCAGTPERIRIRDLPGLLAGRQRNPSLPELLTISGRTSEYLLPAVQDGSVAIMLATPDHRRSADRHLADTGVDVEAPWAGKPCRR